MLIQVQLERKTKRLNIRASETDKATDGYVFRGYMSALTNDAKTPSSCSKRFSGVSYSKMLPRFITMTRSAVRMVWTRCWKDEATPTISNKQTTVRFITLETGNGNYSESFMRLSQSCLLWWTLNFQN